MEYQTSKSNRITLTWLGGKYYLVRLGELFEDWNKVKLAFASTEDQMASLSQHLFDLSQNQSDPNLKTQVELSKFSDHAIPNNSFFCPTFSTCGVVSKLIDNYIRRVKAGEVNPQPKIRLWFDPPLEIPN